MKTTVKMLILLIATSFAYTFESSACDTNRRDADSSNKSEGETRSPETSDQLSIFLPVNSEEGNIKPEKKYATTSGTESGNPLAMVHGN